MYNISILTKLEDKLICFFKFLNIFKNSCDSLYYIRLNNTKFTYYVDVMINMRENSRLNLFDDKQWSLLYSSCLDSNELIEYKNNMFEYNIKLLAIIFDENKLFIPEINFSLNIIEFKNGIYNVLNETTMNYKSNDKNSF
jgi:hypothetical protein